MPCARCNNWFYLARGSWGVQKIDRRGPRLLDLLLLSWEELTNCSSYNNVTNVSITLCCMALCIWRNWERGDCRVFQCLHFFIWNGVRSSQKSGCRERTCRPLLLHRTHTSIQGALRSWCKVRRGLGKTGSQDYSSPQRRQRTRGIDVPAQPAQHPSLTAPKTHLYANLEESDRKGTFPDIGPGRDCSLWQ